MREFFRQLSVRQKVFVLVAIAMLGIYALNIASNVWLASKNPIQQHLAVLTPLLHQDKLQNFSRHEWQQYINLQQDLFSISESALYDINGSLTDTSSDIFPTQLNRISLSQLADNTVLLPGPGFTLMVKLTPHISKIFLLELIIISLMLMTIGFFLLLAILYFVNRLITRPILSITATTNEIAMEQNYSLRTKRFYDDEVGILAENFNYMLNRIEQDSHILKQEKDKAEQSRLRAIELSKKMHDTNERLEFEVKVRARVEHKLTDFQQYLNNIIDSMPSAIIAIDHDLKVTQWNKGATQITQINRDYAIYQPLEETCEFLLPYLNILIALPLCLAVIKYLAPDVLGKEWRNTPSQIIQDWGGKSFFKKGKLTEVNLNGTNFEPGKLTILGMFNDITDVSLENVRINEQDLSTLAKLPQLEWLNLYQTAIKDKGAQILSLSKSIKFLPVGQTGITDHGVFHLCEMKQLIYLGLRANRITDQSAQYFAQLENLESLYLGETKVSNQTVQKIATLPKLKKLWLHDTKINDKSVPFLAKIQSLEELHIYATGITNEGAQKLRKQLPRCRIIHEVFPQ